MVATSSASGTAAFTHSAVASSAACGNVAASSSSTVAAPSTAAASVGFRFLHTKTHNCKWLSCDVRQRSI